MDNNSLHTPTLISKEEFNINFDVDDIDSYVDVEQEVINIIRQEIGEKRSFNAVILQVEKKFKLEVSASDLQIISKHYISICGEFWKIEICDYLKQIEQNKHIPVMSNFLVAFQSTGGLCNVYQPFKKGTYYNLLIDHYEKISKENEESLMCWYKNECYEYIKSSSNTLKIEVELLEALLDFLYCFKSINSGYLLLYLNEFCFGKITISELIAKIGSMNDQYSEDRFRSLQTGASKLECNNHLYLKNEFIIALSSYLKPVKVSKKAIDARSIIEITGTYIVISECLKNVEQILRAEKMEGSEVHEVHFVGALVVHIDADLDNENWHGRNIVVCTRMVRVHGSVAWDVSGKNTDHIYNTNAGTDDEGDGIRGKDGFPGESGGNVLFVTDNIENGASLKVISNGGNGSNGQNGGDGRDGRNGLGISKDTLDKRFPPSSNHGGKEQGRRIVTILDNIKSVTASVKTAWIDGKNMSLDALIRSYDDQITTYADIFIEVKTTEGNEIVFSSAQSMFKSQKQSMFLYKGSNGTPGHIGGLYGLGGQGGFAGGIEIEPLSKGENRLEIQTEAVAGSDGNPGKKGINGKHGKNGWDIGYLDYFTWRSVKYYGTSEDEKLKLERSADSTSWNIWSEYYERYVGFEAIKNEHSKQSTYKHSAFSTCTTERQHHAIAVNKKNVSKQSILDQYSQQMNNLKECAIANNSKIQQQLHNVGSMAMKISEELTKQIQNKKQEQKRDFKLIRHCIFSEISEHSIDQSEDVLYYHIRQDRVNIDLLVDNLTKHPSQMDYWFQLTSIELGELQLNRLLEIEINLLMDRVGMEQNSENLQAIRRVLDEKCRFLALSKIAELFPIYLNIPADIKIQAESATKFLIEENSIACFSNDYSSTLKEYLWNDDSNLRQKVFQYCNDIIIHKDAVLWSLLVRTFFIELKNPSEKVMHLHDKYNFYAQKCSQGLIVFRESLEKLDNECRDDPNVMKELKKFLLEKGPLSKSYRLLLANMLNVNIRTYIKDVDDDNKFFLSDEYNPGSNEIMYLLLTEHGLHELYLNKDHLEMEVERRLKSQMFLKILAEIEPLRGKQEFDDYVLKLSKFIERINDLTSDDFYEVETSKNKRSVNGSNEKRKSEKDFRNHNSLKYTSFKDLSKENITFHGNISLSFPDILKACEYTGLYLDQMEDLNEIIQYFPEEREKHEIVQKFHKISKYIGYPEIVHNVQRRFACEGRHVSYEELSCLINSILSTFSDREEHLTIVSWIVAAHSQQNWIDELLLMKIEDYLKIQIKDKKEWRARLSKIENKKLLVLLHERLDFFNLGSSVTYQCFGDIFYLLSKISHEPLRLGSLRISEWPYILREKHWILTLSTLVDSQKDNFTDLLYYLLSIENTYGTDLMEQLVQSFQKVTKYELLLPRILEHVFCNLHDEKWALNALLTKSISTATIDSLIDLMEIRCTLDGNERTLEQLIEMIENNGNTSKNIIDALPTFSKFMADAFNMEKIMLTEADIKKRAKSIRDAIRETKRSIRDSLGEILYIIDKAIELEHGFTLRDTQKLAILSLTINPRNTLAQVSTGEGKSLIVVATAIIKALQGKKVHIVTSSSVLAKRDAEENAKIFNLFDVYASHNCNEDIEKRKKAYSNNQVIYGDLSNFQRDYLLDRFYGKRVLGDHDLENVIIDEVDSMLLDKGNNMLYLSHNLSGFDKLQPLYIFIWQWINSSAGDSKKFSVALDTGAIKEAVLDEIYIRIHKFKIDEIHVQLKQQEKLTIWAHMIVAGIIDERGHILKENITEKDINGIVPSELECASSVRYRLRYILNECINRVRSIDVPKYLKSFVEQHLESWIHSAITAFFMKSGEDYVVDLDNTDTSQDRNPNIIIIDRDTGTDVANSQWDEALYQFLQLKHGCKLSLQNLKAVFISNVSYFKKYKTLNRLTGTLGTKRDRDLLQEIHNVDYVIIPTATSKQFHEEISIVCTTKEEWKNQILDEAKKKTNEKKRSVLIICETVNVVNDLYQLFGGRKETHVHTYTRDYEQFEVAKDELKPGQIIIATNLAGRGTDIKISEDLNKAGGLHVVLTYLPNNVRIEQQAFGRAARCGAKGSGILIILNAKKQKSGCAKILELKRNRDKQEFNRLAKTKVFYDVQITTEEECFEQFNAEYGRLKKELKNKQLPDELQTILLDSCLDKWALWLDKHSKWISINKSSLGKAKFQSALNTLIRHFNRLSTGATECSIFDNVKSMSLANKFVYDSQCWRTWVKDNPSQMVKLGKYLSQNLKAFKNTHDSAISLFDDVIQIDPLFSEVARYYKACLLIKQLKDAGESERDISSVKCELRLCAKLFVRRIENHFKAASFIGNIKRNITKNLIQINAFEDQQRHLIELYNEFIASINDMLGHPVASECFISQNPWINKSLANAIFGELLQANVLKPPMMEKEHSEQDLKVISAGYGVSVCLLKTAINAWGDERNNGKDFRKHLEQRIPIPNRRQFWTMMLEKKVLCDNKQYVCIRKAELEGIDCDFINTLREKVKKEHKEDILNLGDGNQMFYADWTKKEKDNELIFENEYFRSLVGQMKYDEWNELNALSFNEKANKNCSHIENVRFDAFDSIRPDDFTNVGIDLPEAEDILAELLKQNVLVKESVPTEDVYRLNINLNEINEEQLTFFTGYKQIVKQLLSYSFAYRIAYDELIQYKQEKISQTKLELTVDPHRNLMMELFEKNIVVPTFVASDVKDLHKKVENICMTSSNMCLHNLDIIKYIDNTLRNLRSSLQNLHTREGTFNPLPNTSGRMEEQQIFELNGLDCLVSCGEEKWSKNMLFNTLCVSCLAAGQVAFGMAVPFANGLVSEGFNDLLFAIQAMEPGKFSWENYLDHKWRSLLVSTLTSGILRGAASYLKSFQFGSKVCKLPLFNGIKKLLPEMLSKIITLEQLSNVAKRLTNNQLGTITMAVGYYAIDKIVQKSVSLIKEVIRPSNTSDMTQAVQCSGSSLRRYPIHEFLKAKQEISKSKICTRDTQSAIKLDKNIKNYNRAYKEKRNHKRFKKLKQKYKEQKKHVHRVRVDVNSISKNKQLGKQLKRRYHKHLLKLMMRTRSADFMADLVKENIPMDFTCIAACPALLSAITKKNITIIVEGPDGKEHIFSENRYSYANEKIILLNLKENHFTLCEESMARNVDVDGSNNNCLYVAMMQAVPEMNMSSSEFRNAVANCIRTDPAIRRFIEKGYHHKLLARGFYGGKKRKPKKSNRSSKKVYNIRKSRILSKKSCPDPDSSQYAFGEVHAGYDHFACRFNLTLCAKGVSDAALSADPRLKYVFIAGPSVGQDQTSGLGSEADAAHLIRVAGINDALENTKYGEILKNMINKTQNVDPQFNRRKPAKLIDALQSEWLPEQFRLMMDGEFEANAEFVLEDFKTQFIDKLKIGIICDPENAEVYQSAIDQIQQLTLNDMKNLVRDGYELGPKASSYAEESAKRIKSKKAQRKNRKKPENEE